MQNQIEDVVAKAGSNDWLSGDDRPAGLSWPAELRLRARHVAAGDGYPERGWIDRPGLGAVLWEQAYHTAKSRVTGRRLAKIMVWVNLSGEGWPSWARYCAPGASCDLPPIMARSPCSA